MAPLIRAGDQVLVRMVGAEDIRFGDIAVFRRNGDLIVHRLFRKRRTGGSLAFSEKGDAGIALAPVDGDDIIGMVTIVRRRGRLFGLSSRLGRLASIGLSAWMYGVAAGVARLRSSRSRSIRRVGRVLTQLSILASNILVRVCFAVWYPSGLAARRNGGLN